MPFSLCKSTDKELDISKRINGSNEYTRATNNIVTPPLRKTTIE